MGLQRRGRDPGRRCPDDAGHGHGRRRRTVPVSARANRTASTEAWPPNVPVAGRRPLPLGSPVIQTEGARDNMDQDRANVLSCLICQVIVRLQDQEHCASITCMIRHYVARWGGDRRSPT
jgi:hypothetical protein